jgi:DNA-binding MurR/RpiR family transcriptional regulator
MRTPPSPVAPTSETFDSLRERIRNRFEDLSPHLQRIARLALDQPNQLALQTIAATASSLGVQPSTLIRFAKEFGYDGFSGMQQVFKLRLIEGAPVYRERVYEQNVSSGQKADANSTLNACVDSLIASLEQLRDDISPESLSRAVSLCRSARHIYVAGLRRSRPIATYFAYGMTRQEMHCSLLDFAGGMAAQQVANMGHEDLLVAIAFAPYSPPVLDVVRDAHLRGLPVIGITDIATSPIASHASLAFCVDTEVTGQFRPISGAIGLVQAMIVGLSADI